jgi:hypothetical protein
MTRWFVSCLATTMVLSTPVIVVLSPNAQPDATHRGGDISA